MIQIRQWQNSAGINADSNAWRQLSMKGSKTVNRKGIIMHEIGCTVDKLVVEEVSEGKRGLVGELGRGADPTWLAMRVGLIWWRHNGGGDGGGGDSARPSGGSVVMESVMGKWWWWWWWSQRLRW